MTIVLTFVIVALFVRDRHAVIRYPSIDLSRFAVVRLLSSPGVVLCVRFVAALVFVLTVCAGLFGAPDAYSNLIVTMVWVVWWVGFAFACALIGNLWALVNPLASLFAGMQAVVWRHGTTSTGVIAYPHRLAAWPAVIHFLGFAWAELIWRSKDVPSHLAYAVIAYAVATWLGMWIYGRAAWLSNGEAFSVAFGVLARFAPLGVRDDASRHLELRPYGAGLLTGEPVRVSYLVFVLLMLATVTFDGFQETPLMQQIDTAAQAWRPAAVLLFELSEWGLDEQQWVHTVTLALFPMLFVAVFWLTCKAMLRMADAGARGTSSASSRPTTREVACGFVLTLVPIAVAYHLSHYFSLLLTAGQFIIPLASDPFGVGWNLFGTAGYKVDLGIVSPYVFWYSAVTIIVVGHVVAVLLAHVAAVRMFGSGRPALASQLPMMALMVAYTTLSLWILAQPIVG